MINQQIKSNQLIKKDVSKSQNKDRMLCLDVFRGLTMIYMIIVNCAGDSKCLFYIVRESSWDGLSPADCIFPTFLFIMGSAIAFSVKQEPTRKGQPSQWYHIIKRALMLILFGLLINIQMSIPYSFNFDTFYFRIPGVLQRIGICYLIVAFMHKEIKSPSLNFLLLFDFLMVYAFFMFVYDVPECGPGRFTEICNFSGYLDRQIFGPNFMLSNTDPEGILSTLTAVFNTYMGVYFGILFQKYKKDKGKLLIIWLGVSAILLIVGVLAELYVMPSNKKLWSISFAIITSGVSGTVLATCLFLMDILQNKMINQLFEPTQWFGMNPLFIFIGHSALSNFFQINLLVENSSGQIKSFQEYISNDIIDSMINYCSLSSLTVALLHLSLWIFIAWYLYVKKIFFKI